MRDLRRETRSSRARLVVGAASLGLVLAPLLPGSLGPAVFAVTAAALPGLLLAGAGGAPARRTGIGLALLLPATLLASRLVGEPLLLVLAAIWVVPLLLLPSLYARRGRGWE